MPVKRLLAAIAALIIIQGCSNNPHPDGYAEGNTIIGAYSTKVKYVDPVKSYYSYEAKIIDQIYETLFQYHYLKRPFELIPALAREMPRPVRKTLTIDGKKHNTVSYLIRIKTNVYYAENECFKMDPALGRRTRLIKVDDFLYSFKRIADPALSCPIYPIIGPRIIGMPEFFKKNKGKGTTDYSLDISGIRILDDYSFEILLADNYPQILYWMAMHFTAPIPHEAITYYRNKRIEKNGGKPLEGPYYLDWPVGSGPYKMGTWKARQKIILVRNDLFREEYYPTEGEKGDKEKGLLQDAGKRLPFVDRIVYNFDKESIPVWNKFMQGYYDMAGIPKEQFDNVINDDKDLTPEMIDKGIVLDKSIASDIYYFAFNMTDDYVGGYSEKNCYLRQALSKVFDRERFIRVFRNNRGIPAQSPLPPGIFGYRDTTNKYGSYDVEEAKRLLAKAGYPNGIDPATGQKLKLTYDNANTESSGRPMLLFIKEEFEKLGINLVLDSTDLNTFRKKINNNDYQIFTSGWILDYPDPENFLFLLYGPFSTAVSHGENRANYQNKEFDRLFKQMETMPNTPERMNIINRMVEIVNHDAPWLYWFHSEDFILYHDWLKNLKVTELINNKAKYYRIDNTKRIEYINRENKPALWPVILFLVIFCATLVPGILYLRRKYA